MVFCKNLHKNSRILHKDFPIFSVILQPKSLENDTTMDKTISDNKQSLRYQAAQTKTEQIKHIRAVYAQAKQKVSKMSQNGKAAHKVHISKRDMGVPEVEHTPEEDTEMQF